MLLINNKTKAEMQVINQTKYGHRLLKPMTINCCRLFIVLRGETLCTCDESDKAEREI